MSDKALRSITNLLQLERRARQANSTELPFIIVNETLQLLPYNQAVLWVQTDTSSLRVEAVSGVAALSQDSPFLQWLTKMVRTFSTDERNKEITPFAASDFPSVISKEWGDWLPGHGLWVPLGVDDVDLRGGLVLFRETSWTESEIHILSYLAETYAHVLALHKLKRKRGIRFQIPKRPLIWLTTLCLFGSLFLPIRQSVLAPAEIIAQSPILIRASHDGVVDVIHIRPNEVVAKGGLVASLDPTQLNSRLAIAEKNYEMIQAEYFQSAQQALSDRESRAKVKFLKGRLEQEAEEVTYIKLLLTRMQIKSPVAGVAIFDDSNALTGRPVVVGERIMEIADPKKMELEIRMPTGDAIALKKGTDIAFFLNILPAKPIAATLYYSSFQSSPTHDGQLAFRLRATFTENNENLRIGLRGTAKVYGQQTHLGLVLLRKPLSYIRQWLYL